ncbi:MAG: hypothetical protein ACR2NP_14205, partial [Pirellulaceae bacterium]
PAINVTEDTEPESHVDEAAEAQLEADPGMEDQLESLLRELHEFEETTDSPDGDESVADNISGSTDSATNQDPWTELQTDPAQLFGDSFENEEPVEDVQSSIMAEQNRASSTMSAGEIADLAPTATQPEFEDVSIPQIIEDPQGSADSDDSQTAGISPTRVRNDDADMLIMDDTSHEAASEPPSSESQPPQGQVIRMNYQDLFQQLRNHPPTTEA